MIVAYEQIGAFDQLHAHFPSQERVFEIGTVETARGQHHRSGVIQRAGALEGVEQQVGVVVDGRHALAGEQLGEQPHHHLAVFEHIAHATGGAQVVFKHVVAAITVTHQVDPGDVGIDVAVQVQALHCNLVTLVRQHLLSRDDALLENALVVIDVGQEHVQRLHPLNAAAFDYLPLAGLDAAGDDIEGNQTLGTLFVTVEGEGDTGSMEQQVGFAAALLQQFGRCIRQPVCKRLVMGTAGTVRVIHFVEKRSGHTALLAVQNDGIFLQLGYFTMRDPAR